VHVFNSKGSSNNLPCYPPDSHQSHNAVYWRTSGTVTTAHLYIYKSKHYIFTSMYAYTC